MRAPSNENNLERCKENKVKKRKKKCNIYKGRDLSLIKCEIVFLGMNLRI